MSAAASSWAWKQDVDDPLAKLVLLKLADNAGTNDSGGGDGDLICWPAVRTIAKATGAGDRTIQRKLALLEEGGFIRIVERKRDNGSRGSNLYVLLIGLDVGRHSDTTPPVTGTEGASVTESPPEETPSLLEPVREEQSPAAPKRVIVWDILAEHFGHPTTTSEKGDFAKTVNEIKRALENPDDEVAARAMIEPRIEAMGDFRSHRSLRNRWTELGERSGATPIPSTEEPVADWTDPCPCLEDGKPDPDCPECSGTGKFGWGT